MALNPQFMISPNLQEYFVDKTTGLPLTAGIVTFYSDVNRTQLKNVYQLTGYPDYTYTELPNPLTLSDVGTTVNESGEDVRIYYYTYDDNGNVELYYITVESSDNVTQLVREAWPNFIENPTQDVGSDVFNYIPNGQFRTHYDIENDTVGEVSDAITVLAPGGWTFERPNTSTAIDVVTFYRYGSYVSNPTASPRYAVNVACNGANPSDSYKYLAVKFSDVNKFAGTQDFTFTFNATLGPSSSFDVNLFVIKNYGTGGSPSPTDTILKDTFTIIAGTQTYTSTFSFDDNTGKGIGSNNDDYVQIAIGFPTDQTYNADFTDFSLVYGNVVLTGFPIQTDADCYSRSIFGDITETTPDGMDLYLPVIKTKSGTTVDYSQVGKVYPQVNPDLAIGELQADGATYETDTYSTDGIPYLRLYNKLADSTTAIGRFGTGVYYVIASWVGSATDKILLSTNFRGIQSLTANGTPSPGFSITTTSLGTSNQDFFCYFFQTVDLWVKCTSVGATSPIVAGTANISVIALRYGQDVPVSHFGEEGYLKGVHQIVRVGVNVIPTAGQYFNIYSPTTDYYVWFRVNGSGDDPAPGGTGIRVDILSTMTITEVTRCIGIAINAWQGSTIHTVAGSSIPANSYWSFNAAGIEYYVWYALNGSGIDPSIPGGRGIKVSYTISDTAAQVGQNTILAINRKYYAVPDLQGMFIRGVNNGSINDPDADLRFSFNPMQITHDIGTTQFDEILSHRHQVDAEAPDPLTEEDNITAATVFPFVVSFPSQYTGGDESRPINMALNYIIKY